MPTHVDDDPITTLGKALQQTTAFLGHVEVLIGIDCKARTTAAQRIVIYPADGSFKARSNSPSIIDLDLTVAVALWGSSLPHLWDLLRRLAQAYDEHRSAATNTGPLWEWQSAAFATEPDTSNQGESCVVQFVARALPLEPPAAYAGLVDTYSIIRT